MFIWDIQLWVVWLTKRDGVRQKPWFTKGESLSLFGGCLCGMYSEMAPLLGSRYTKEHKTKEFIHMWIHCQWKIRESEYSSGIGTGWPGQRNAKFLRDLKDWEPVKGIVEEKGQLLWGLGRSTKGTRTGQKQVASMAERERDGDRRLEAPGSARKGFRHESGRWVWWVGEGLRVLTKLAWTFWEHECNCVGEKN